MRAGGAPARPPEPYAAPVRRVAGQRADPEPVAGPAGAAQRSTLLRHLGLLLVGAVLLLVAGHLLDPFRNYQLATVAAYLCATSGLTVLIGLNGQLSLGHGALMATGAYTVALSQNTLADRGITGGWLLPFSLLLAVLTTIVLGAVIGVAAARLRGPYLAGVTLAVAVVVPALTVTFDGIFNGEQGLAVQLEPPPAALGPYFPYERWQLWVAGSATLLALLLVANVVHSRYGRDFRAVRDDETAAALAGIHVARTQILAFVLSAATAGLGGGLLAVLAQSVSPGAFSLTLSLFLLMAVVLGGLGSLAGAAWGAAVLVVLPELSHRLTDQLALSPAVAQRLAGNLPLAIFGGTLIVVMIAAPGGLQGALTRLARARPVRARLRYARKPARRP